MSTRPDPSELTRYLWEHIPVTGHMGLVVAECTAAGARLEAPLVPNINHRETAFGGSIASAAILGGWVWIHAELAARRFPPGRLVVQNSRIDFTHPIERDFEIVTAAPPEAASDRFFRQITRHGRARLALSSEVRAGKIIAARQLARYVAFSGERREIRDEG